MGMFKSAEMPAYRYRTNEKDAPISSALSTLATSCRFTIPAPAVGAVRMVASDKYRKRPRVLRYWAWCALVRDSCANPPPAESVSVIRVDAYYVPPESWSKRKRDAAIGKRKRTRPDPDNIFKGIGDALWKKDAAIGEIQVDRRWGLKNETVVTIELEAV